MLLTDINSGLSLQKNTACPLNNQDDPGRIIKYSQESIKPFQMYSDWIFIQTQNRLFKCSPMLNSKSLPLLHANIF